MGYEARQAGYAMELEDYFRAQLVDGYEERSKALWRRDYSSEAAYLESVSNRREAWRQLLAPPELSAQGEAQVKESLIHGGRWITVPLDEHLTAQGALVVPDGATKLVVFVHGLGSTPERVFGVDDERGTYDAVGRKLVEAGYAVLAPMNLIGIPARNRAQQLCRLAGTTMEGLEFARFQCLLQAVWQLAPELDQTGYALTGMSWGGLATQYWAPLDERVVVAGSLGFFNDRCNKMVVQDTRYGTFYDTGEEHAFIPGLLQGFGDADLASLICPRPFYVSHGRADMIGWWPQIVDEFNRAKLHWHELGLDDQVKLHLHDDGHEVKAEPLVEWLQQVY